MFLALLVYLTMVVMPFIVSLGGFALFAAIIITGILGLIWLVSEGEYNYFKTWAKSGWLKLCVALAILGSLTPSKEVTWYMIGAYAAEKVATADATKQIAGETYDLFRDLIKKARENINEADATKLAEKTGKAIEAVSKAVDNNDTNKQGENK